MGKIIYVGLIASLSFFGACGTQYELDEFVDKLDLKSSSMSNDEFSVTIISDRNDDSDSVERLFADMLCVQTEWHNKANKKIDELKSVTVFAPRSLDDWNSLMNLDPDDSGLNTLGFYADETSLDRFVIGLSPSLFSEKSKHSAIEIYAHELGHYVSLQTTGSTDDEQTNIELWGNDGLSGSVGDVLDLCE